MKILLVTSLLAKGIVEENSLENDVYVMPIQVAAFINCKSVALKLEKEEIGKKDYDMILLPGRSRGSTKIIEDEIRVPTFKGPKHAQDLPYYLNNIESVELSKESAANKNLTKKNNLKSRKEEKPKIEIGKQEIYDEPKMIAEIQNIPNKKLGEIKKRAAYFIESGADIVDLGLNPESEVKNIQKIISELRSLDKVQKFDIPLSIDSMNPAEIRRGLEADIDLIISVDEGIIEECVSNTPTVLIPTNQNEGVYYRAPDKRINYLMNLRERALDLGYGKLILDPILEPSPYIMDSLKSYKLLQEKNIDNPVLAGVGNVVEMIDADSVGINALLAGFAKELDWDLLLQVEASRKTKRSVKELKTGLEMFQRTKNDFPKNLSKDLLRLKEKNDKGLTFQVDPNIEKYKTDKKLKERENNPSDDYYFKIFLRQKNINIIGFKEEEQRFLVTGKSPNLILNKLQKKVDLSKKHIFYLGKELEKAKICLNLDRSYIQEEDVFEKF